MDTDALQEVIIGYSRIPARFCGDGATVMLPHQFQCLCRIVAIRVAEHFYIVFCMFLDILLAGYDFLLNNGSRR
jgi:hypothetical protein